MATPGRDPRMNVVTVGYLAVIRYLGDIVAGTDAAEAALVPVADILDERLELAFDHLAIVRDAIERVRIELEVSGIATAFVGQTFTMAELRAVYEAIWGVQLDAASTSIAPSVAGTSTPSTTSVISLPLRALTAPKLPDASRPGGADQST